jgi:transcriptional regulator PpsR
MSFLQIREIALSNVNMSQPDVTLLLDMDGVIRDANFSSSIPEAGAAAWLGRPWVDTVVGGDKVRRMIDDAVKSGVSAFRQITQRFPSGLELPMEYTTLLLGGRAGLMAIGKNLQAVAELQTRLIDAQQTMERDYWKLREVETRYRLLFETSNEAVLLVRESNLRIIEGNPAALEALGLDRGSAGDVAGREILSELPPPEREPFHAMLLSVRENGKAPGIVVHLGSEKTAWIVRASLINSEPGPMFLLQLVRAGQPSLGPKPTASVPIDELMERVPDGFVVIDREGIIKRANRAFLDLIEMSVKGSVIGENLSRWLWRPGADLSVLLANVHRHRLVRLFSTTLHGELGSEAQVEIAAAGSSDTDPQFVGILLRDVGRRLHVPTDEKRLLAAMGSITEQIGKTSLRELVDETIAIVEKHHVKAALEMANGNRTAAAEILGLSRQSLYAKLNRYNLDGSSTEAE